MSATCKWTFTKPSANDLWYFEDVISYHSPTRIQLMVDALTEKYSGFISYEFANSITVEELELKKNELRPDIYHTVFESTVSDPNDLSMITVIDYIKKYNIPIGIDPYSNTHIEIIKFDTWEHLITAYTSELDSDAVEDFNFRLTAHNNTLVEEFYIDDVKQDYPGLVTN